MFFVFDPGTGKDILGPFQDLEGAVTEAARYRKMTRGHNLLVKERNHIRATISVEKGRVISTIFKYEHLPHLNFSPIFDWGVAEWSQTIDLRDPFGVNKTLRLFRFRQEEIDIIREALMYANKGVDDPEVEKLIRKLD